MELKPGFKQTEVGVIPEDWKVVDYVSFGQVIDGDRGVHYPGAGELGDRGDCLFLNAGNVTKRGFRFAECQFILSEKDKKLNKGKLTRGDVILTTRGTVGNLAFFDDGVPFEHIRINSGMVILRNTSPNVANTYQYLILRSRVVESQIERLAFGSAQPQLTVKGISTLKIPFPPTKAEQEAIAMVLGDVEALLDKLDALIAKKRDLKQAAMQQLLTGQTRLQGFSGEWEVKLLPDVCSFRGGKAHEQYISEFGRFVCVNSKFISTDGKVRKYSTANFCCAKQNDVLMVMSDLPNGRALAKAYLVEQDDLYAVNQRVCALTAHHNCPKYMFYILNRNPYFLKFDDGVNQTHLLNNVFRSCPLPIPPTVAEQTAIATVLSDMVAEIAILEERRDKTRALKHGMMQELLTGKIRLV